jgi:hypothetical protein
MRRRSANPRHGGPVPGTTHLDVHVFRVPPEVEQPAAAALPVPTPILATAERPQPMPVPPGRVDAPGRWAA